MPAWARHTWRAGSALLTYGSTEPPKNFISPGPSMLVMEKLANTEKTSTGADFLDEFLKGGYEKDVVTTLFGPSGSGKTNLCLLAAVRQAEQGKKVIFLDTEGGIAVERVRQVTPNYKEVLSQILFFSPVSFEEQKKIFEQLRSLLNWNHGLQDAMPTEMQKQNNELQKTNDLQDLKLAAGQVGQVSLIVIDSISMLYRLELGKNEEIYDVNSALGRQIAFLVEIARRKKIPVLLTTQVYSDFDRRDAIKMVGGDLLRYGSKCLLELQKLSKAHALVLRKHRSLPAGRECLFRIVQEGVEMA